MLNTHLSEKEFNRFRDLIYEEAGIHLNESKKALVQARLTKRIRTLRIDSFSDYFDYLTENYDTELSHFINSITTNKTDFFRENRHFEFMRNTLLPEFEQRGGKRLRIWSAGCSTGEEPYTIAITIRRYFEENKRPLPDVKILATDIDTTVLATAAAGIYRKDHVQEIEPAILHRFFKKGRGENDGLFMVKDDLKSLISFRQLNLQLEQYPMKGLFDCIFCRNVIIYFDKDTQRVLFNKYRDYIASTGYLFIGHSENISTLTNRFKLIGNTIYRPI